MGAWSRGRRPGPRDRRRHAGNRVRHEYRGPRRFGDNRLVIVLSYAGFASPLVILITFVASLCCALSIAEFARRVPSAGWAYTYNSRGLARSLVS